MPTSPTLPTAPDATRPGGSTRDAANTVAAPAAQIDAPRLDAPRLDAPRLDAPRLDAPPVPRGWRWAPLWVLAFVWLWPLPTFAEAILVLGAIATLVRLVVSRFRNGTALLDGPAWALTTALFFAYWTPELVSTIDAVDVGKSLSESLLDLRYLPFVWLVAMAVADGRGRRITFGGLAIITAAWTIDGLIAAATGTSPLYWLLDAAKVGLQGRHLCTAAETAALDRLGGVLGPCNLKLGIVMASLSPFLLHALARRWGALAWLAGVAAMGVVVLLAGARAGWVTFALIVVVSGWRVIGWRWLLALAMAGLLLLGTLSVVSPQVQQRLARTAHVLDADSVGVDEALSGRTLIWSAAACMIRENPLNGVGVRGFRDAYPTCDASHGTRSGWGPGPAFHAHQLVLEILSETGAIGLLLWLAGAALAWRAWRFADAAAREDARPAMLALAATLFPFNTHLASYSTFWGSVTLLLAALYAGSLLGWRTRGPVPGAAT